MAAVTLLGTQTLNTSSGTKTVVATPAVGDVIVIVTAHTGNTSAAAPTDNNSGGAGGAGSYTRLATCVKASSADTLSLWIRESKIGSASSTTFTHAPGTSSGGGLGVFKITGMSRAGFTAFRQAAVQSNQGAATPTPVLSVAALTGNPLIGAVFNATSPAGMTARSSPAWSERFDVGYSTPTTGLETMTIDSGETGTSIAWGSSSASAFCSLVVELNASAAPDKPFADVESVRDTRERAPTLDRRLLTLPIAFLSLFPSPPPASADRALSTPFQIQELRSRRLLRPNTSALNSVNPAPAAEPSPDVSLQVDFTTWRGAARKLQKPTHLPLYPVTPAAPNSASYPSWLKTGFNYRRDTERKLLEPFPQPQEDLATWTVVPGQTQLRKNTTSRILIRVPPRVFLEPGSPSNSPDRSLQADFKTGKLPVGKRRLSLKYPPVYPQTEVPEPSLDYQPPPSILYRGDIERNLLVAPKLTWVSAAAAPAVNVGYLPAAKGLRREETERKLLSSGKITWVGPAAALPIVTVLPPAQALSRRTTDRWLVKPIPLYVRPVVPQTAWKLAKPYRVAFRDNTLREAKLGFYKTLPVFIGPSLNNLNFIQNVAIGPIDLSVYFRGGQPSLTYSMVGSLPAGLSLSGAGVLSGTPTVLGTTAGLQVSASNGAQSAQSNAFSITISPAGTVIGRWFKLLWRLQVTQALLDAGYYSIYTGSSSGAGATAIDTDEVSTKDCFMVSSVSGSVEVLGQLREGGAFSSALALQDLGDITGALVAATVAGKMYGFVGNYHKLRIRQVGGTAVTEVLLRGWSRTFHG